MLALHLATALVALAVLTTSLVASPPRPRSLAATSARRRRLIDTHRVRVTSLDVLEALVAEGMPRAQARLVTETAAANHLHPHTLWLWLQRVDAGALGIVVAADLGHEQLLDHVAQGTVPDLGELAVFAAYNGLDVDAAARLGAPGRRVLVDSAAKEQARQLADELAGAHGARSLPPIFEPGTWPDSSAPRPGTDGHGGRDDDHLAA